MPKAFNCKTIYGDQIVIPIPNADTLTTIVADATAPVELRQEAAVILARYRDIADQPLKKEEETCPEEAKELSRAANTQMAELDTIDDLRDLARRFPGKFQWERLEEHKSKEPTAIASTENPTPNPESVEPEPNKPEPVEAKSIPGSAVFEPAVPFPVIPPADAEKQAIHGVSLEMRQRYSPKAVAERVAAIEREAARLRATRDQTI